MKDVDPKMYEVLVRQNIHSLVVVPLYDDGKVIGFYGVDNPSTRYFEFVSEMLQIMGHFIVSSEAEKSGTGAGSDELFGSADDIGEPLCVNGEVH